MSGFEIRGIQNVSFVDLKTGKKINIENAEVSTLSKSKDVNEREPTGKLDISKTPHFTCELTYFNMKEISATKLRCVSINTNTLNNLESNAFIILHIFTCLVKH